MNIAILDDELHCVESLHLHLTSINPDFNVVYKGTRPVDAVKELRNLKVDLLFLDVEMPLMNGFEFLQQFEELTFDVIFTTAYSEYAIQAFKAQAVNYLLKPIDECELKEALDSWQENRGRKEDEKLERLLELIKKEGILHNKIAIPVTDGIEFIDVSKIIYCKSQNNYSHIYLVCGKEILISKTLKDVEAVLDSFSFLRVHQSYLINPNYMQKYSRNDGGYLVMINGQHIPISNMKKKLIADLFNTVRK